jgi:hypothetical protein
MQFGNDLDCLDRIRENGTMPKSKTTSHAMTDEHKAALAKGREEGLAVRRYLEASPWAQAHAGFDLKAARRH